MTVFVECWVGEIYIYIYIERERETVCLNYVCFTQLMARINPFIAVSLKSKLLKGYCNACARWAQFSFCHRGGVFTRLGPAVAACSYISSSSPK